MSSELLDLWDYRRRVAALYAAVRADADPAHAWLRWRAGRDALFASHPQSPLEPARRAAFTGLAYFPYDSRWRIEATLEPAPAGPVEAGHSGTGTTTFRPMGTLRGESPAGEVSLALLWLDSYGGGVFLPFRDGTNGTCTYGGGRYLLDSAKGADLGHRGSSIVLDFNFAFHPSCVHSPRWSCPLAPPSNLIGIAVEAGERLPAG